MLNLSLEWWQLLLLVTGYVTYKELVKFLLKRSAKFIASRRNKKSIHEEPSDV